ncbi:MAG: three-Cys-motif partner protein TcmP [Bacteroidales bacterium]|nr:three-Cys-motif partner protein TcmP [Bacteroidales bacterium]
MPRRIGYYDLFAGPGKYDDGNPSTPILLARNCVKDSYLRERVWMVFNDKEYKEALEQNFTQEFPTGTFTQKVYFRDQEVGTCQGINTFLVTDTMENGKNECPAVLFIDPFGYKNIDTSIIAKFLSFWGNEAFIFINTKRINPAFENDKFDLILRELFPSSYKETKANIRLKRTVAERLQYIIDSLGREYQKLVPIKGREQVYYTAFKFQEEDSVATSHYILHITKSRRGFDLIKQVYTDFANVGTIFDGVNTYTFDPKLGSQNSSLDLFDTKSENIDVLKETLYLTFKDQTLTAIEIFESHQIKTLYSRNHYTEALRRLVNEGRVTSWYTDGKQHKVSVLLNEYCHVRF